MKKNKRWNFHKGHSTHALSSFWEADDSVQRDNDQPIHSQKSIPDNYERDDSDDK